MDTIGRQSPTVSVVLPYTDTKGAEAVEIYDKTEHNTLEWQVALLYDLMAQNEEGLWTHQKFGYSVPRRNGKSEIALIRCLWGLKTGEKILYTAHRATTSHSIWERLERLCAKADITISSSIKAIGKEHLYADTGGEIHFRTRTSTGGLGEGYDLLIIDEAQEYTPEQQTALKYVIADSPNPQTLYFGTPPTAISAGTVFPKYRDTVLQGAGFESGWAEWSVPDMTDPHDVDAWYETNPSLGTVLSERAIRGEIDDDETDFNIQRLGLWLKYNQKSAISRKEWDALMVTKPPKFVGPLFVAVKFGHDSANVSLSLAVKTDEGKTFVETIGCRPIREGVTWIVNFIRTADVKGVIIDGDSGKKILEDALRAAKVGNVSLARVGDIVTANSLFEQMLTAGELQHSGQPSVVQIVSNCEHRHIGSAGGFGYKSQLEGADISILESLSLAAYLCKESKPTKKQTISY